MSYTDGQHTYDKPYGVYNKGVRTEGSNCRKYLKNFLIQLCSEWIVQKLSNERIRDIVKSCIHTNHDQPYVAEVALLHLYVRLTKDLENKSKLPDEVVVSVSDHSRGDKQYKVAFRKGKDDYWFNENKNEFVLQHRFDGVAPTYSGQNRDEKFTTKINDVRFKTHDVMHVDFQERISILNKWSNAIDTRRNGIVRRTLRYLRRKKVNSVHQIFNTCFPSFTFPSTAKTINLDNYNDPDIQAISDLYHTNLNHTRTPINSPPTSLTFNQFVTTNDVNALRRQEEKNKKANMELQEKNKKANMELHRRKGGTSTRKKQRNRRRVGVLRR